MNTTKLGFARTLLLPALMLFLVPAFGAWFAGHAARSYDQRFHEAVFPQIERDTSMNAQQKQEARTFYTNMPPSSVCLDTHQELEGYRQDLGDMCSDIQQFAWARAAARAALLLGLFAVVFALLCALASFLSRGAQYMSFAVGWNVLKVVGAIETLLQGGLLVWLSFWTTALWTERYFIKLIGIAGVLAAIAAYVVVRAIFRRPQGGIDVEGEQIAQANAPELWSRIKQICAQLQTEPPTHIVAGIDDNFFVTEGEVRVGGEVLRGRVLYVSLSLLRLMQRSEADAVLAHEMAHFSGGDTSHSRRLSPLIGRFVQYLQALHEGVISRPIYYFMRAYFAVFQLSLSRSGRAREHEADKVAAKITSPRDIARSLVKVGAYASYRGRVEEALFEKNEAHGDLGIAQRVASGFSSYASSEKLSFDLHQAVTPHPFDSHPPLKGRVVHVGATLDVKGYDAILSEPVTSSWLDAIANGAEVETRLWKVYEDRFAAAHDLALAYRYEPANDAERCHVEKHFPELAFGGPDSEAALTLDYACMRYFEWDRSVSFDEVKSASIQERMFKKYLDIQLKEGGLFKSKMSICLSKLHNADPAVQEFNRYYGRHQMMVQHRTR